MNTVKKLFGLPNELANNIQVDLRGMSQGGIRPPEQDTPEDCNDNPADCLMSDFTEEEKLTLYKGNNVYKPEKQWFIDCKTDKPYSYNKNPMVYSLTEIEK